jgi:cell division protein FtsB
MVARYLEINKPTDQFINLFKQTGFKFKTERQDNEGANELDEKEQANYQSLEYFKTILGKYKLEDITDKNEHYGYLLLSLLVLQPPLRTNFYNTAKFSDGKKLKDGDNYLVIQKTKDFTRLFYKSGNDKVSKSKYYSSKPDLSVIEIDDKQLKQIILKSQELYPRTYLFQNNSGGMVKADTLLGYLKKITNLQGVSINMMRSVFITNFYDSNKTFKQKTELANMMRNSVETAQRAYYKITDASKPVARDEEIEKLKKELETLKVDNNKLKAENEKLKQKNNENYEENKNTPEYKKKRRDILYRVNSKNVVPKEQTLEYYGIKLDEQTKKYV